MNIAANMTDLVGGTPMVRLQRMGRELGAEIAIKLEFFNPLSSVKDRIAKSMIEAAEADGSLKPGMTVVEATSGNTGIGLAFVCASRGYPCLLVMPDTMSVERRKLLEALGAKLVLTPGEEGMNGALEKAEELAADRGKFWISHQFANPANPEAHRRGTGEEIWRDTDGRVDIFVVGVGTGGSLTGTGDLLKKRKPELEIYAVEPVESAVLSGGEPGPHKLQGIGAGFIPEVMDLSLLDGVIRVTQNEAGETARRMAREEGILGGISSGANLWAAMQLAGRPENQGKLIVTLAPSCGERYLSTWLYGES